MNSSIEPSYRVAVSAGTFCSLNRCVGSISVYRNLFVYEQLVYEFLLIFSWNYCSQYLFWRDIIPRIFSNAQNTMISHSGLCSSSSITLSFFSVVCCELLYFNQFQCLHLKKLIFVCYILCMISPKLFEFSTQL